jgi:hypothetical protein
MIPITIWADLAVAITIFINAKPGHITGRFTASLIIEFIVFLAFSTPPVGEIG